MFLTLCVWPCFSVFVKSENVRLTILVGSNSVLRTKIWEPTNSNGCLMIKVRVRMSSVRDLWVCVSIVRSWLSEDEDVWTSSVLWPPRAAGPNDPITAQCWHRDHAHLRGNAFSVSTELMLSHFSVSFVSLLSVSDAVFTTGHSLCLSAGVAPQCNLCNLHQDFGGVYDSGQPQSDPWPPTSWKGKNTFSF